MPRRPQRIALPTVTLFALVATLALASPAAARCMQRSATLVSPATQLPRKGVLVIRVMGNEADRDAGRFIAEAYLVAKKGGRKMRLRLVASLPGAKKLVQFVVAPRRPLRPGDYVLHFPKKFPSYPQPVHVVARASTAPPAWRAAPRAVPTRSGAGRALRAHAGRGAQSRGRSIETGLPAGAWVLLRHVGTSHAQLAIATGTKGLVSYLGASDSCGDAHFVLRGKDTFEIVPVSMTYRLGKARRVRL